MIDLSPPGAVGWICRMLERAGHETWAVGGAVRDALAGLPSGDWDLTTRARPQEVRRLFPRTVPVGMDHGTVGVLARDGTMYEVTTFRRDVETTGRHAVVAFADSLDEDLARRDFTINAVAWHPRRRVVHDPHGGRGDLEAGILRTVGDPAERFAEDYLRVLRALRFAGAFGLQVEATSWRALVQAVPDLGILSPERIREEMEKILAADRRIRPSGALALYAASGALAFLYPELDALVGRRDGRREGDPWSHALRTVDRLSPRDPERRWMALLSRIGEPTEPMGAGEEGEDLHLRGLLRAAALLKRLRSSNARIDRVAGTVPWIGEPPARDASEAELRRWISAMERERVGDVLVVWAAEVRSDEARGPADAGWTREGYVELAQRIRRIRRSQVPLAVGDLAFSGRDLIRMGYRPGPHFGELLRELLDQVLEDPDRNDPEWLLRAAEAWMQARAEEDRPS